MMTKKQRDKELKWSDAADIGDRLLYALLLFFALAQFLQSTQDVPMSASVLFILVGLIRIRMLVRAIRVDALLREAEARDNAAP